MEEKILKKLHSHMLQIYNEIERICIKYNLTYFAVGGTLLGAVVHKGFIPWDDDLDIAMPRDDYNKFITLCKNELDNKFYLHHTTTDDNYWLPFAKIRMNNTIFLEEARKNLNSHSGIYVDIFPFDYASKKNDLISKFKWHIISKLQNYIFNTVLDKHNSSFNFLLVKILLSHFSVLSISKFRDKLMMSFSSSNNKYYIDLAGNRKLSNSYFNISDIYPCISLPFENVTIKAPKDPNKYLLQLYTEKYKIIPPKTEQITHNPLKIKFEDNEEYNF